MLVSFSEGADTAKTLEQPFRHRWHFELLQRLLVGRQYQDCPMRRPLRDAPGCRVERMRPFVLAIARVRIDRLVGQRGVRLRFFSSFDKRVLDQPLGGSL